MMTYPGRSQCGCRRLSIVAALLLMQPVPSLRSQTNDGPANGPGVPAEIRLESILRSVPGGIGIVRDRVFIDVNDYVLALTGYTRDQLLGSSARMLYPTQDESDHVGRETYRQMTELGTGHVETRWRRKDGKIRHVLITLTPLDPDDFAAGVAFAVLDITNRKQAATTLAVRTRWFMLGLGLCIVVLLALVGKLVAELRHRGRIEQTLKNERDQLLSLFNSIDEAIYIVDPKTYEVLYVNRKLADLLESDAVGAKCYQVLQGLAAPCSFCTNDILFKREQATYRWEYYNPAVDRHYQLVDRLMTWSDGREVRFELAIDITAFKQTQKMLAVKNEELEQVIYIASHDLRSPLVNVDGFSREIAVAIQAIRDLPDDLRDPAGVGQLRESILPDMQTSIDRVITSVRQMDALIKGLLKLSRQGRAVARIERLDMNERVRAVVDAVAFRIRTNGVTVSVGELPACLGDAVQVTQVMSNLVDNAIKYLDPDRSGVIRIDGYRQGDRAVYRVNDNGIGIAEAHKTKIFEVFHRLNPRDGQGEGLGLTLVRQMLSRMDGDIRVESSEGKGSTFIVSLPRASRKKTANRKKTACT